MIEMEPDQRPVRKNLSWVVFFSFLAVQSIPVIIWILSLPRDPKNSQYFGLSGARLALLLTVLSIGLLLLIAAIISGMSKSRIRSIFQDRWCDTSTFLWLELVSVMTFLIAWGLLVYLRSGVDGPDNPIYLRMQPLLLWLFILGVLLTFWFWNRRFGWSWKRLSPYRSIFEAGSFVFIFIIICGVLIWQTGLGISPDIFLWGYPGVPLLAWQVSFALLASFLLLTILISFPVLRVYQKRLDWIISISLFILAAGLWLSQPIPHSYFFPAPRAPTFQSFPYSDAGFYDYISQSILIGEGFLNGRIVTRPLYILLLAIFHGMENQNYAGIITIQTLLLATFPAVLYWLGRTMHSREAGFAAGLLAIFRELNMIAATPLTEVSNSKMLMTDSLTGLGICVLCLVVFRWLRKPDTRPLRAIFIGGYMGLLLLLRAQAITFLPVIVLLLLLQRKKDWRGATRESVFFVVGVVLAVSPWILRNGIRTGDFALDQPSLAVIMAQRYSSSVEEAKNLVLDANSNQVSKHIGGFIVTHPGEFVKFVSAHLINNELATLSVLPVNVSFDDMNNNLKISSLFWLDGVKAVSGVQWILLILNLLLVSIGLGAAMKRWGWAGISPLAFHLMYSFSSAAGRISGWRFIQPVDWIGVFYFCLGFSELAICFFAASNLSIIPREKDAREKPSTKPLPAYFALASAAILLIGIMLPAAEWIVPIRYTQPVKEAAIKVAYESAISQAAIGSVDAFMKQPMAVQMVGRVLYPRWYKPGAGEPGTGWAAFRVREQARLGFMIVGPDGDSQMVLFQSQPPADFKHASDVIVYGCQQPDFVDVRLVIGYNQPDLFAYKADNLSHLCE